MYNPKHFQFEGADEQISFCRQYPFATVVSVDDSHKPCVSHLPILLEKKPEGLFLVGHIARRNPHFEFLKKNPFTKVIFQGPHAYITPTWYVSGRDVPTWNYTSVQISGQLHFFEDFENTVKSIRDLSNHMESFEKNPWKFELPADLKDEKSLLGAIAAFEIPVLEINAKFKLSQNRSAADQSAMIQGLMQRDDQMSHHLALLMRKK